MTKAMISTAAQSVILHQKTQNGTDAFNNPTYTETTETVDGVLIGQPSSNDVINEMTLSGKHIIYQLAIPKDDRHTWENAIVEFYGHKWRVVGIPTQYMADGSSLDFMGYSFPWNKQVKVERYE